MLSLTVLSPQKVGRSLLVQLLECLCQEQDSAKKEKYCRKPIFTTGMSIDFWSLFLRTTGAADDSLYRVQYLGNALLMMARE